MGAIALAKADLGETGAGAAWAAFDCALGTVNVSALALGLGELALDLGLGAVGVALLLALLPVAPLGGAKEDGKAGALPRGLGGVLALALASAALVELLGVRAPGGVVAPELPAVPCVPRGVPEPTNFAIGTKAAPCFTKT